MGESVIMSIFYEDFDDFLYKKDIFAKVEDGNMILFNHPANEGN